MKKLLLKLLFFLYRKEYNKPLNASEVDSILTKVANNKGLEDFPRYLAQCADSARNRYLYSKDEILKGTIFAMVSLKEQILDKRVKRERDLTREEKNVIMKKRGY
jgi:hypothetical protein